MNGPTETPDVNFPPNPVSGPAYPAKSRLSSNEPTLTRPTLPPVVNVLPVTAPATTIGPSLPATPSVAPVTDPAFTSPTLPPTVTVLPRMSPATVRDRSALPLTGSTPAPLMVTSDLKSPAMPGVVLVAFFPRTAIAPALGAVI